jgi:hypothetical protein
MGILLTSSSGSNNTAIGTNAILSRRRGSEMKIAVGTAA